MSQSGDLESFSPRFLEVEEGLHRRESTRRSLPRLVNLTSSTFQVEEAVTLNRQTSRSSSSGSTSPKHAGAHDKFTGLLSYGDVRRATRLTSPACSDTQEEAATPSHRLSGNQGSTTPTALADIFSTPSTPCNSPPGASSFSPEHQPLVEASPPPSPLSLSHPVVEFLASVQLQGYAAHIMCNAGIRSMLELVAHAATSKGAAELLGPLASMQQQNELLRGIRRWQRDEARRVKAEAAEARRRVQKGCHNSNTTARDLCAKKRCTRAVKAKGNVTTSTGTEAMGGGEPESSSAINHPCQSVEHCGAIGGYASMRSSTGCDSVLQSHSTAFACGTADSSSHALLSGYREAVASPRPGPLTCGATSSVSFSCPSLTTSATQLMQQLSYRCSHSRQALARGHRSGLRHSRRELCSHQGETVDVSYPNTINVIPYDVDAEDVDNIAPTATAGSSASSPRKVSDERLFSRSRERSLPQIDQTESRGVDAVGADEESLPNYAQQERDPQILMENRDGAEVASPYAEEIRPLAARSPSSYSRESRLSSILSSLYEAAERQPAALQQNSCEGADREGPTSARWVVGGPSGGLERPLLGCVPATAESQDVVHNKFVTTSNISLGALSASAELQVLAPLNLVMSSVGQRPPFPSGEEADGASNADGRKKNGVVNEAKESEAVCNGSQPHRQPQGDRSVAGEPTCERSQRAQQHALDDMHGNPSAIDKPLGPLSSLDDRLADARRRLSDALQVALQSYNAEVGVIERTASSSIRGKSAIDRCVPFCAVLHPIRLPTSASSVGASGTEAGELEAPSKLVYVLQGSGDSVQVCGPGCPSCSPTTVVSVTESGWCSAGGLLAADGVEVLSLDEVALSSMTSTNPSARTTVISTVAPESLRCLPTLPLVATAAREWPAVAGGIDASAAAQTVASSSRSSGESGSVSCESLGLLTVGTQRPSKHVSMADAGLALDEPTTLQVGRANARELDGCMAGSLWVTQDASSRNQKSFSEDASTGEVDRKEVVPNDDEWWEAYGIEALEYTQNCVEDSVIGRAASPGVRAGPSHAVLSDAAGVLASEVQTPSPVPLEVMELSSDTDTDGSESSISGGGDDAYSRFGVAASRPCTGAVSQLPPSSLSAPRNSVARCPTSPSCSVPMAPMLSSLPSALDPRLHAEAWSRMSNADLRDLCREFGLPVPPSMPLPPRQAATASIGVTASPSSPAGAYRRCRSVPFFSPEVDPQTLRGTATSRESSPERNLFELPTTAASSPKPCREPLPSSADLREGVAQHSMVLSPIPAVTPPGHGGEGGSDGCPVDSVVAASCALGNRQRAERRAAAMEREVLLEALRLLCTRLCFRHKVAPFFLHRVTRLSGLPYKRIRVGDRIDEGAVLTRDALKRERLRYKAEEQAEVDRCIVSALAAEAAEAVEQEAHRVAARWTMTSPSTSATKDGGVAEMEMSTIHSALVSLPDSGTLVTYNKILLREPVEVDAAVAAVQSSFPHISHTRVQQLLSANEVLAEAVTTPRACSPSPSPSSPRFPLSSRVELDAEQRFAVPRSSDELAGALSQQSVAGGSRLVHATETQRPLSQGERRRVNARRFFAQRGHQTRRRQSAWAHGLLHSGRSFGTLDEM